MLFIQTTLPSIRRKRKRVELRAPLGNQIKWNRGGEGKMGRGEKRSEYVCANLSLGDANQVLMSGHFTMFMN